MLLGIVFYLASGSDNDVVARLGVLATLISIAGALLGVVSGLIGWTVGLVPGVERRNLGLASALLGVAVGGFWAFVVAVIPG
jgi:hypothetical protein